MAKAFPGAFRWRDLDTMTLEDYGEAYDLAVETLEAEAEAIRNANRG